jgi:hypothetical protein
VIWTGHREQKDSTLYDAPKLSTLLHILYAQGLVEEQVRCCTRTL